jgi:hypothetical protein
MSLAPGRFLALLACCCGLGSGPAAAHDSWLVPAGHGGLLQFSTGNRYPLAQSAPPAASIETAACTDAAGRRHKLRPREVDGPALGLAAPSKLQGPLACWATIAAHEIALEDDKVSLYLREIRPPQPLLDRWSALREAGRGWQERYRKFARIEISGADAEPAALRAVRAPAGLPLEIVVEGDQPLRVNGPAVFRVLSEGNPVAGLSVELVSERSPFGIWSRSDAQGRLRQLLPFGGRWILRATLLEPAGDGWESRFVTLAFKVAQ